MNFNVKNIFVLGVPVVIGIVFSIWVLAYDVLESDQKNEFVITEDLLIQNASILGDENAKITILEFGDYQCTFCYKFHKNTLPILMDEYVKTGKIKMVFRDFPLNGNDSIIAGEATYCADDQNKYWDYHDVLYQNWAGEKTGWIKFTTLYEFARTANLDLNEFTSCLSNHNHLDKVLENEKLALKMNIDATPTFLIFDDKKLIRIIGSQPIDVFRQVINEF